MWAALSADIWLEVIAAYPVPAELRTGEADRVKHKPRRSRYDDEPLPEVEAPGLDTSTLSPAAAGFVGRSGMQVDPGSRQSGANVMGRSDVVGKLDHRNNCDQVGPWAKTSPLYERRLICNRVLGHDGPHRD